MRHVDHNHHGGTAINGQPDDNLVDPDDHYPPDVAAAIYHVDFDYDRPVDQRALNLAADHVRAAREHYDRLVHRAAPDVLAVHRATLDRRWPDNFRRANAHH